VTLDGAAMTNDDLAEFMKALANVVWTNEGMGPAVETGRKGESSRVELNPSGQVKDFRPDQIGVFFKDIRLKARRPALDVGRHQGGRFPVTLAANCANLREPSMNNLLEAC